jgi:hypothetical protein
MQRATRIQGSRVRDERLRPCPSVERRDQLWQAKEKGGASAPPRKFIVIAIAMFPTLTCSLFTRERFPVRPN